MASGEAAGSSSSVTLGEGTYGVVTDKSPRRVIKHFKRGGLTQSVVRQMAVLKLIGLHPGLLTLCRKERVRAEGTQLTLLRMDTDLANIVAGLTDRHVRLFSGQLLSAVQHIHRLGVAHRDIKLHNVLVNGRRDRVRLTDWDLSTTRWSRLSGEIMTDEVASRGYRPPEVVLESHLINSPNSLYKVDAWSTGCCILAMCERVRAPFPTNTDADALMAMYKQFGTPSHLRHRGLYMAPGFTRAPEYRRRDLNDRVTDHDIRRVLTRLLMMDPSERANVTDIRWGDGQVERDDTAQAQPGESFQLARSKAPDPIRRQVVVEGVRLGCTTRSIGVALRYMDRAVEIRPTIARRDDLAIACLMLSTQMHQYMAAWEDRATETHDLVANVLEFKLVYKEADMDSPLDQLMREFSDESIHRLLVEPRVLADGAH